MAEPPSAPVMPRMLRPPHTKRQDVQQRVAARAQEARAERPSSGDDSRSYEGTSSIATVPRLLVPLAHLASEVRRIQELMTFPSFLREMGTAAVPTKEKFTAVLRGTVRASVEKGCCMLPPASQLVHLRVHRDGSLDPAVVLGSEFRREDGGSMPILRAAQRTEERVRSEQLSFFPPGAKGSTSKRGSRNADRR